MRIAIFGSGGVGGYFGARLAQSGHDVIFVARGAHLAAMRKNGLQIESVNGDFTLSSVQVTDSPAEIGPVDAVLLGVKAWQVTQAAEAMRPMIGEHTVVVPLQNGVDAPAQLAAVLGEQHVLGGFCRIVSYIVQPGHIRQAGGDAYVAFGRIDNQPDDRAGRLRAAFLQTAGVKVEIPADIQAAMWWKFMSISAWSGMGALTRVPVGVWRSLPQTRQMWQSALQEVSAVAHARGILPADGAIEQITRYVDKLLPAATASMQRDIMAGRPSELETLNGAVARMGQEAGVPTPVNSFIYGALLPQELSARQQG